MTQPICELCGEPMPLGETMFKFHGYSGPCPKPPLPKPDANDHVAWCRYNGTTIVTCDSDAEGAFRVYRRSDSQTIEDLERQRNFLEQNETVLWEILGIPDGSTVHDVVAAIRKLQNELSECQAALACVEENHYNKEHRSNRPTHHEYYKRTSRPRSR